MSLCATVAQSSYAKINYCGMLWLENSINKNLKAEVMTWIEMKKQLFE